MNLGNDQLNSTDQSAMECPFCNPSEDRTFLRRDQVIGLWDAFPVSPGHALLIPVRHIPTWFEATAAEHVGLVAAIDEAKEIIEKHHRPDGYNIGINCGAAAGQTVFHLHVHLIPRYQGDVADPRGGIRHVIPAKAKYLGRSGSRSDDSTSQ
jgi:diadenosine tetraphosphate (Ap4A) HIT family hydrolase